MSKKRKRIYIDRFENLSSSSKKPNLCAGLKPFPIENKKMGCCERHFIHKLVLEDHSYLIAYVMANDICVLVSPEAFEAQSVSFPVVSVVSGKRKKGAKMIHAGSIVVSIMLPDGTTKELRR